ncbi:MAG: hypothetical protein A2138_10420 [Deltaproteobacteria bacterium RBG_16_71_12]|nr:MAG: hypothetical protein A2138_10420 [Deltaproteobacteria bacterium RBG_16_71_12]
MRFAWMLAIAMLALTGCDGRGVRVDCPRGVDECFAGQCGVTACGTICGVCPFGETCRGGACDLCTEVICADGTCVLDLDVPIVGVGGAVSWGGGPLPIAATVELHQNYSSGPPTRVALAAGSSSWAAEVPAGRYYVALAADEPGAAAGRTRIATGLPIFEGTTTLDIAVEPAALHGTLVGASALRLILQQVDTNAELVVDAVVNGARYRALVRAGRYQVFAEVDSGHPSGGARRVALAQHLAVDGETELALDLSEGRLSGSIAIDGAAPDVAPWLVIGGFYRELVLFGDRYQTSVPRGGGLAFLYLPGEPFDTGMPVSLGFIEDAGGDRTFDIDVESIVRHVVTGTVAPDGVSAEGFTVEVLNGGVVMAAADVVNGEFEISLPAGHWGLRARAPSQLLAPNAGAEHASGIGIDVPVAEAVVLRPRVIEVPVAVAFGGAPVVPTVLDLGRVARDLSLGPARVFAFLYDRVRVGVARPDDVDGAGIYLASPRTYLNGAAFSANIPTVLITGRSPVESGLTLQFAARSTFTRRIPAGPRYATEIPRVDLEWPFTMRFVDAGGTERAVDVRACFYPSTDVEGAN